MEHEKVETNFTVPLSEKMKGLAGVFGIHLNETPHYELLFQDGDKEIRSYDARLVAVTSLPDNSTAAQEEAFERLAGFIFGRNQSDQKIPMTAPVLREENDGGLKMSFILPKDLTLATAPVPENPNVAVLEVPKQVVAVLKYSGQNTPEKVEESIRQLKDWVESHHLLADSVQIAQYDSPYTIPFLRRNEIQIVTRSVH